MNRTSRMQAISNPTRWGLTPVNVFFGQARPTGAVLVLKGDTVQAGDGRVGVFQWREGDTVHVEWEA